MEHRAVWNKDELSRAQGRLKKDGTRLRLEMSSCELAGDGKNWEDEVLLTYSQDGWTMERGFELSRELIMWAEALAVNGVAFCPFQANADWCRLGIGMTMHQNFFGVKVGAWNIYPVLLPPKSYRFWDDKETGDPTPTFSAGWDWDSFNLRPTKNLTLGGFYLLLSVVFVWSPFNFTSCNTFFLTSVTAKGIKLLHMLVEVYH